MATETTTETNTPKKFTKEELVKILKDAKEAARLHRNHDDGGSSNFDSAVFFPPPSMRRQFIESAAAEAGVHLYISSWMRARCVFVCVGEGQGFRRTEMSKAACEVLKKAGLQASMYYQMD